MPGLSPVNCEVPFAERTALKRAVADWCLRNASRCLQRNAQEKAAQWDLLAAQTLNFHCSPLVSIELEQQLIRIAEQLPLPPPRPTPKGPASERWLHVFNEAFPYGGHTAMVHRWIRSDPRPNRHSVALLSQRQAVPLALMEAVESTGGTVLQFDPDGPVLAQALRLRTLAWQDADVVVLHIHAWDVISTLAFGVSGGPPVLFLNHTAHHFWVGACVADAVLNLSISPQEDEWTRKYRGIGRRMHLPIPLPVPIQGQEGPVILPEGRQAARELLGLPSSIPILLTVGDHYKYTPVPGLDFLNSAVTILKICPDSHLYALGVKEDARWKSARELTEGRLHAIGRRQRHEVALYEAAADVYLEGFPFGSTTALLEAGLLGLPCVRAPKTCPPPFCADGVALSVTDQPDNTNAYVDRATTLVADPLERKRLGRMLAASIRAHHTGAGWARYISNLQNNRPTNHRVHHRLHVHPVPSDFVDYWGIFSTILHGEFDDLARIFREAILRGLRPRSDAQLRRAVYAARRGRSRLSPPPILLRLTQGILSLLTPERALRLYDDLLILSRRDGRMMRTSRALRQQFEALIRCGRASRKIARRNRTSAHSPGDTCGNATMERAGESFRPSLAHARSGKADLQLEEGDAWR